jgi:peptide deformylase
MTGRTIRLLGDPVLRTRASEVTDFGASLRRLVADLSDTLAAADGSGLAAPQIGVGLRAFVYRVVDRDASDFGLVGHLVNPVLHDPSAEEVEELEGCLSVPGVAYPLARARRVVASGMDMYGEPVEVVGSDWLARTLLHEADHLDGVLFLDRLDPDVRRQAMREIRERMLDGEAIVVKRSPHLPLG